MVKKERSQVWKWVVAVPLVLLLAGTGFVYGVLPGKVALSIAQRSKARETPSEKPGDYGITRYSEVTFPADRGITLTGWWMPAPGRSKPQGTLLMTHGAFHNRGQVLGRAAFLNRAGWQVLLFDARGHGLSSEAPLSGGIREADDFPAAVRFLEDGKKLQRPLIFFGFSMGAMSALRAARLGEDGKGTLPEGIVADSPLANLRSFVSRGTMAGTFASLPGFLGRVLSAYDGLTGLDLQAKDLDLLPVVQGLDKVPVIYISGEKDDLALPEETRKLFERTAVHQKRLVFIPDAGHEQTYKSYPMIYERLVLDFLKDLKAGFPEIKEMRKFTRMGEAPKKMGARK